MILFFDTETTGLPKNWKAPVTNLDNWPRLVQLAYLVYDFDGNLIHSCNEIIKPIGFTIPMDASKVHGITTDIAIQRGSKIEEVFELFSIHLKRAKVIVAHNMAYDEKIIGSELIRLGLDNILDSKEKICTMESTVDLCKIDGPYGYKWPKLEELHRFLFKYDFDGAHDALADIQATAKCFWELTQKGYFTKINDLIDQSILNVEMNLTQHEIADKIKYYPYRRKGEYSPYIFVDSNRNPVFFKHGKPLDFDLTFAFEGELAIVKSHIWYGIINKNGDLIIPPTSDSGICKKPFIQDNVIIACKSSDRYGILNNKGEEVLPFIFSNIEYNEDGFVKVQSFWSTEKGIYKFSGEEIIPKIYEDLKLPSEGLIAVKINTKWGYLNLSNNIVINPYYDEAFPFKNGIAPVYNIKGGWSLINLKGECIVHLGYSYDNDSAINIKENHIEFINNMLETDYYNLEGIRIEPKNGYLINTPEIILNDDLLAFCEFENYRSYDGESDLYCGYSNINGDIIIHPQYLNCMKFSEGLAVVVDKNTEILIIDSTGEVIFRTGVFDENLFCDGFKNGIVILHNHNEDVVITRDGKLLLENFRNHHFIRTEISNYLIHYNRSEIALKKIGMIDLNGNEILPDNYSSLTLIKLNKYYVIASINNKYGIIDLSNDIIVDFDFDYIDSDKKIAFKNNLWYIINNDAEVLYDLKFYALMELKSPFDFFYDRKLLTKNDFLDPENFTFMENGTLQIVQGEDILTIDVNFKPYFEF